ncbi:sialin-like isoform X3 [Convolutriloba macropyga]|uniref:sialin-like isoform X3 n=1 Tax=Convolutriloba macropyga TaxID=536237 RepID=UPI003F520E82
MSSMDTSKRYPKWPSTRFTLALLGWMGFALVYAMRVNLSIAIVKMVEEPVRKHEVLEKQVTEFSEECPGTAETAANQKTVDEKLMSGSHKPKEVVGTGVVEGGSNLQKYKWSEQQVSSIMGAFYYGYMITQIPGGYLATVYGGKWVYSFGITMASLLTLITPWAASMGPDALWLVRFLMGLFEAVTFPSFNAMLGRWVPVFEKSVFSALALSGGVCGNVVFQIIMGYICSYEAIGGWPLGFYLIGSLGILFVTQWNKHVSSCPQDHPTIDPLELEFIRRNTQPVASSSSGSGGGLPWKRVVTSLPMWAIMAAHFGNTFIQYGLMTCLPQYLSHVLNFDISQNGVLCALPWGFCFIVTQLVSLTTDRLRESKIVTTTRIRRINGLIGALVPAMFLVLTGYSGCNYMMAVVCVTIGLSFAGFTASAYNCNHLDLSPQHAGTLFAH